MKMQVFMGLMSIKSNFISVKSEKVKIDKIL